MDCESCVPLRQLVNRRLVSDGTLQTCRGRRSEQYVAGGDGGDGVGEGEAVDATMDDVEVVEFERLDRGSPRRVSPIPFQRSEGSS